MPACNLCGTEFAAAPHVRWRKDGYDVVRCPSCGLLFRAELPTRAELAEIYGLTYFHNADGDTRGQGYLDYVAEEPLHRQTAARRLTALERLTDRRRLLDVGAAAGFFVAEASARGWDARGVDVSEPMVTWGREHLAVGLELGDLHEVDLPVEAFDAVTMWDYIEHSLDPAADLRRARELLRPGGVLALSTGDAATLVARVSGIRWHLLTPRHHNFFFTERTLHELLRATGFDVVESGHPGNRYSLAYLAYKLRTLADVAPLRAAATALDDSRLGALKVPVNLGDIVTVTARRR